MLTDPEEIELVSAAVQPSVRDPRRPRRPFIRIMRDFLREGDLESKLILDLGPGQYDFGVLARKRGAEVHAVDNDPAIVALGRHKGFTVFQRDIKTLSSRDFVERYDGVICKYSVNAFWFADAQAQREHIAGIGSVLKPTAWIWIAPWNGDPALVADAARGALQVQADGYKALGCTAFQLNGVLARRYGVHGRTHNRVLFTRRLAEPWWLRLCRQA